MFTIHDDGDVNPITVMFTVTHHKRHSH